MSGDPLRKVRSGDRLVIPARAYNGFIDAARDFQERQRNSLSNSTQSPSKNGIVFLKNSTGSDLNQFSVVGIDGPLFGPDDNEDEFRHNVSLKGVTPDIASHYVAYAVTQEPIATGKIGKAMVAGMTVVQLEVKDDDHMYAVMVDGDTGKLQSSKTGTAQIQWKKGAKGETDWALVALGASPTLVSWGKATSNWHNGADNGSYVDCNPCKDRDGAEVDTTTTVRVYLPRHGSEYDPNVVADSIVPYIIDDPTTDPVEATCIGDYLDGKIEVSLNLIMKSAEVPEGWEVLNAADQRVLAMNVDPPEEGFDKHGETENNHDDHPDHDDHPLHPPHYLNWIFQHPTHPAPTVEVGQISFFEGDKYPASAGRAGPASISGWDGWHPDHQLLDELPHTDHTPHTPHEPHTDTSNWPPWYTVKLIKRIDNSA